MKLRVDIDFKLIEEENTGTNNTIANLFFEKILDKLNENKKNESNFIPASNLHDANYYSKSVSKIEKE